MGCVAVGWLVRVTLLVGDVVCWSVSGVFAVGWQLWGAMWADGLLFWVGAGGWLLRELVVDGCCGYFEWWVLLV